MAVSEVRINQKRNLKQQVFCKTDVLKYSLKVTGWHLHWSVFSNDVTRFETANAKTWKLCMFCIILNEQHGWKGKTRRAFVERNCFILSDYGFKLFSKILQLFNAMWAVSLPPICFWHAKKDIIYAWIVHRWIVNHWIVYCELAKPWQIAKLGFLWVTSNIE